MRNIFLVLPIVGVAVAVALAPAAAADPYPPPGPFYGDPYPPAMYPIPPAPPTVPPVFGGPVPGATMYSPGPEQYPPRPGDGTGEPDGNFSPSVPVPGATAGDSPGGGPAEEFYPDAPPLCLYPDDPMCAIPLQPPR